MWAAPQRSPDPPLPSYLLPGQPGDDLPAVASAELGTSYFLGVKRCVKAAELLSRKQRPVSAGLKVLVDGTMFPVC